MYVANTVFTIIFVNFTFSYLLLKAFKCSYFIQCFIACLDMIWCRCFPMANTSVSIFFHHVTYPFSVYLLFPGTYATLFSFLRRPPPTSFTNVNMKVIVLSRFIRSYCFCTLCFFTFFTILLLIKHYSTLIRCSLFNN